MRLYPAPIEPGVYWGRTMAWWNLVVEVRGQSPFLKVTRIISLIGLGDEAQRTESIIWGPKINPPDEKEESK